MVLDRWSGIASAALVAVVFAAPGTCRAGAATQPAEASANPAPWMAPRGDAEPVVARLLADTSAVVPGRPFRVGVLLKIQPGWHVYWKNPGQAGLATEVRLTAPRGFSTGPIEWPTPVRFDQGGQVIGFGYTDAVLLMATVRPPQQLDPGSTATFVADVSWLACLDRCVPGGARLELKLDVNPSASSANAELFQSWAGRLPKPAGSADAPATVSISGSLPPDGDGRFAIVLNWRGRAAGAADSAPPAPVVTNVDFFPAAGDEMNIDAVEMTNRDGRTTVSFRAGVLPGQKRAADTLEAVIGYDLRPAGPADGGKADGAGESDIDRRRGVRVVVPLVPERDRPVAGPDQARDQSTDPKT